VGLKNGVQNCLEYENRFSQHGGESGTGAEAPLTSSNRLVSTQSLYNVHQSRIWFIGFSGSELGLVKIILGKYIPDWEAENPSLAHTYLSAFI